MKIQELIKKWWRQHKLRNIEDEIEDLREEIEQLHLHLNHLVQQKYQLEIRDFHRAQPAWRQ